MKILKNIEIGAILMILNKESWKFDRFQQPRKGLQVDRHYGRILSSHNLNQKEDFGEKTFETAFNADNVNLGLRRALENVFYENYCWNVENYSARHFLFDALPA